MTIITILNALCFGANILLLSMVWKSIGENKALLDHCREINDNSKKTLWLVEKERDRIERKSVDNPSTL